MAGEIIRKGDRTSHDGIVLEGSAFDICHGKPIAYVGHKTHCPKCKGDYPIVEGVLTTTFFGKGVAVAGMKTSCGAILIPSQFTDTVQWNHGASESAPKSQANTGINSASATSRDTRGSNGSSDQDENATLHDYDLFFLVKDDRTGKALSNTRYKITLDDGREFLGITDANGHTEKVCANTPKN